MQSLPVGTDGSGFPFFKEDALSKRKTASHRRYDREGLHSQDDFTGMGGGHETPLGAEVSPGETVLY